MIKRRIRILEVDDINCSSQDSSCGDRDNSDDHGDGSGDDKEEKMIHRVMNEYRR